MQRRPICRQRRHDRLITGEGDYANAIKRTRRIDEVGSRRFDQLNDLRGRT